MEPGLPNGLRERLVGLRRDLHAWPEIAWDEHRTMQRVAEELTALGVPHRTGVARTGIVADLPGRRAELPRIALRADLDGLPIEEETGLSFRSRRPGLMHACGHDGHTAMLVGAAAMLVALPPPGPVRLLFQPAEETGDGARAMVAAGALDGVRLAFGGHLDRNYETGTIVVTDGPVNAATDTFTVRVVGRGGHGGRPHEAVDAIVVASALVLALQTVVSREVDPGRPAVLTVGMMHAGTAPNIIAGEARLHGTLRAYEPDVRARLREALQRMTAATASQFGASVEVALQPGTPALVNDPVATELARRAARAVVGSPHVVPLHNVNMGGEDFAWYLEKVPGAYVRFGCARPGRPPPGPAHGPTFDLDEDVLPIGAAWFSAVARQGS